MEYDAKGTSAARPHPIYAVPHLHAVVAARSPNWAIVSRKNYRIALREGLSDNSARLHSGPLLGHQKLTTFEVLPGLVEKDDDL